MAREKANPRRSPSNSRRILAFFPISFFLLTVALICLALAFSALNTFHSLTELSNQFLENRGNDIYSAIDLQARGPGRRNNPAAWQAILMENYAIYRNSVAYMALVDRSGKVMASAGEEPDLDGPWSAGEVLEGPSPLYLFETEVGTPSQVAGARQIEGWTVRIALYAASAAATTRMASLHLLVAILTILTLVGLTLYSLWVLRRFVELQARESSERHLASLGRMAATLAHEIRNPLGAVKGLTQVAREQLPEEHSAQPLMESVVSEARRLEQLVTDLLTFARPRHPEFKKFNLLELLKDIRRMLERDFVTRGLYLEVSGDLNGLSIKSDEPGLRQVLLNVVLNAAEASPAGATVRVRAFSLPGTNEIRVLIEDEGEGLKGQDPDELFDPFNSTRLHGTGLGLAISKRIIESLDGSIQLQDRGAVGAVCSITVPRDSTSRVSPK